MARINIHQGSEGPAYDPYAYTEVWFHRTDGLVVVYHSGLAEWCKVLPPSPRAGRHRRITARSGPFLLPGAGKRLHYVTEADNDGAAQLFELATGMNPVKAMDIANKLENPSRCKHCGSRKLEWTQGFPGETFCICSKCGEHLACHFNEAAII